MEGENVKASTTIFHTPQPKAARPLPILHRVLVLPKKSFNDFIRHQVQALIFVSFHQGKENSPSAASRGKAAQWEKQPLSAYRHLSPDGKGRWKKVFFAASDLKDQ